MPYRLLKDRHMLTSKAKNDLKINWRLIFTNIKMAPGLNTRKVFKPNESELKQSYDLALAHLQSKFSFLFAPGKDENLMQWKLGTWSKRTQPAYVRLHGSESDIGHLPEPTRRNQQHKQKRTFTVKHSKPSKSRRVVRDGK